MNFTIKFDTSVTGVADKHIHIQILSNNNGSWDFTNNSWDASTSLKQAHSATLADIGATGVTLKSFTGGARIYVSMGGPGVPERFLTNWSLEEMRGALLIKPQ